MDERAPRRILIIKPSSLGDVVHGLPVLAGLRRAYPDAHIAWLIGSTFAPLLAGHPLLDEVIPFDRRHFGRMWFSPRSFLDFWRFVGEIRRRRFDCVIDLQGLFRSGFMGWAGGARLRVGFAAAREFGWIFYSHRVRVPDDAGHAVDRNLCLARSLGLNVDPPQFPLAVTEMERDAARDKLRDEAGTDLPAFVAIVPGARWPSKQWPGQHIAQVIDAIHAAGGPTCVLLGGPDERGVADVIVKATRTAPVNLAGRTTLRQLCALLSIADQVICMDSGPMHIAAALGRPLVAVFGPTEPRRTGPYSPDSQVVRLALPCMPCQQRSCPLKHHNCMQMLPASMVLEKRALLAAKSATTVPATSD